MLSQADLCILALTYALEEEAKASEAKQQAKQEAGSDIGS